MKGITEHLDTRARDLAIDAAIAAIIRLREPYISSADIQKLGSMDIYTESYLARLDGKPICHVELDGSKRFVLTIIHPDTE